MIHLGDITALSGYDVPPVDVVTGGSPCQDLSVAGNGAGLDGSRSGLFLEQIRLIKEMRDADIQRGRSGLFIRPRYMVWENVPGAFSSHKGQDFKRVLEETIRIIEPEAPPIPLPEKGKWPMADAYYGDGWSVAYRVFDAQFWGVPQRRRRITLVADFGGRSAPEILFIRRGLQRDIEPGEEARPGDAAGIRDGTYPAIARTLTARNDGSPCLGRGPDIVYTTAAGFRHKESPKTGGIGYEAERSPTLTVDPQVAVVCIQGNTIDRDAKMNGLGISEPDGAMFTLNTVDRHGVAIYENHTQDGRLNGPLDTAPTVNAKYGTGGNNVPLVLAFNGGQSEKARSMGIGIETAPTLGAGLAPPVVAAVDCRNGTIDPEINGTLQAKPSGGMSLNLNNVILTYPADVADCLVMATGQANAETLRGLSPTLNCDHEQPIIATFQNTGRGWWNQSDIGATIRTSCGGDSVKANIVSQGSMVRRLTPLECERLQGFPDGWTDIGDYIDTTGKRRKTSDTPRYKAIGNSIAIPPWRWVLKRIAAQYERNATLASLFDGIGGFPFIWEQLNGPGSAIWASEIDEFPIAVTKRHFPETEAR